MPGLVQVVTFYWVHHPTLLIFVLFIQLDNIHFNILNMLPKLTLTPTGYSLSTLLNATECSVHKHEPCQMQKYAMGNSAIT